MTYDDWKTQAPEEDHSFVYDNDEGARAEAERDRLLEVENDRRDAEETFRDIPFDLSDIDADIQEQWMNDNL